VICCAKTNEIGWLSKQPLHDVKLVACRTVGLNNSLALAILVRLWSTWSEPYTDVLHNSSHMGNGIIVYGLSLKLQILRLIEVVHRWFSKRKHILRQLTCWCAIFSGNIPASCDRAYRSARRLRNGRWYKPCLSIIYNVIDKQRLRIRLHWPLPDTHKTCTRKPS